MASNSTSCKTWCVTLVSAVLVIVADKGKAEFTMIALIPTIIFFSLDTYYLALEKGFRNSYNSFIEKLHAKKLATEDLYSVAPTGNMWTLQRKAIFSFSIWGFYVALIVLILITNLIITGEVI